MPKRTKRNDTITVGPQPRESEIKSLPAEGFKTVVNFRTTGEDEQPLSLDDDAWRLNKA